MDNKNGSNATNNLGKKDVNRSDYRGASVLFGFFQYLPLLLTA